MSGFNSQCRTFIHTVTSHPCQLSLAIPSWVGTMSTSQWAVMPHSWGVKAGLYKSLYKLICLLYFTIIEDHTSSCVDCPCAIFMDALLSTVDMFRRPCRAMRYYRLNNALHGTVDWHTIFGEGTWSGHVCSSLKDILNSCVFICHLNTMYDSSLLRDIGRAFQAHAAATGNALSPSVVS